MKAMLGILKDVFTIRLSIEWICEEVNFARVVICQR